MAADPPTFVMPRRPSLRDQAVRVLSLSRVETWSPLANLLADDVASAVATFLAVLLLVRQGVIEIRQDHPFGWIQVRQTSNQPADLRALDVQSRAGARKLLLARTPTSYYQERLIAHVCSR